MTVNLTSVIHLLVEPPFRWCLLAFACFGELYAISSLIRWKFKRHSRYKNRMELTGSIVLGAGVILGYGGVNFYSLLPMWLLNCGMCSAAALIVGGLLFFYEGRSRGPDTPILDKPSLPPKLIADPRPPVPKT
jgi:hypothetical protein